MNVDFEIGESQPEDQSSIESLYPLAFPDEDLLPLVRDLLNEASDVLSLVSRAGGAVIGHCVFTLCGISGSPETVALLGPLAVLPGWQGRGIGGRFVRNGFRMLESRGVAGVLVLGDPGYYGRFGFEAEVGVAPPYVLPREWREAWQSIRLAGNEEISPGVLSVPAPWARLELWGP